MDSNVIFFKDKAGVKMEKIPNGRYTKEFREEAYRLVIENGISTGEAATRLALSKLMLESDV